MTTENSTLVFGIRTKEANASLEQMRRELTKTYDLVDSLTAKQVAGAGAVVGSSKDTIASARAVTDAIEQQELATRKMSNTSVSYRKKVGEASAAFKAGLKTSAADLQKFRSAVEKASLDPSTALGLANIEHVISSARKQIDVLQKLSSTEARNNLQALERAQSQSRARELAALRADIAERSKIAALRNTQEANSLKAMEAAQSQTRARELATLRADITERSKLQAEAAARHAETRRKQAELAMRYDEMELASRIRVLRRISELQSKGYSTTGIARRFGTQALGDVSNLAQYQQQLTLLRENEKAQKALADANLRAARDGKGAGEVLRANRDLMRESHSAARGLAGSLGSLWMTYGSLVPLLTGAALGGVARSTFNVGKDVEYRLQMLQALGNAEASVSDLMPAVHGSMKTPLEAAEGLQQLAQAGLATHEALSVLAPTLQLATLGEMSVADAALATTAALSTFNLGMHEAVKVGDIFAKGASISNASVAEIAEAMKQAGSGAAAYGLSLEDTVAQVTALAQAGIKGSAAGTAVKNSMKELYAPTNKAAKVMKQIGLETYDAEGKARNYMDILSDLKAVTAEMTDEHQNAMLGSMFNERSRRAIQIFLNDMERLEEMSKGLGDPNGYLAKANERLLDTVEGASNRFQSVIQQSYVRAFDALRPQIRATIDEMERFAGSDGFIKGVETVGRAFSSAASAISQNAGLIATLAGTYGTLRLAQMAFAAASALATNASRAKQAALLAQSIATKTLTADTVASTTATEINSVAQATLAGNMTRAKGAAAAAAIAFRGLTAAMGIIGIAISAAALAMSTFAANTTPAISESDKLKRATDAVTQAINAEISAIRERRRQRNLDKGITDVSDANAMQARRELGEKLKADADAAKAAADAALQAYQASSGMGMEVMRQQGIAARDAAKASKEATEAYAKHKQELEADEQSRATGIIERQKAKQEQNLQSLLDEMTYERNTIMRSKADSETRDFLGSVDESIAKVERALNMAGQSAGVAKDYVDGLNNSWGKLRGEIDEKRTLVVNTTNDKGNGGLEFRSSSANLQTELRNQRTLLANMRDFRLKIVEDEAKQGVWTSQQAAEQRKAIWDKYQDDYAAKAAETSAKIKALDKGSDALKDLTVQKVQEDVAQERRLAAQNQQLKLQQEAEESLSRARSMANKTAVDVDTVRRALQQDEIARMDEIAKRYLPNDQLAALDARNKAEEHFNKLLEDRTKLLQQGVNSNPDFLSTPEGKAVQESIRMIEMEKKVAVDAAGAIAMSRYQDTQTITSGYQTALKELGNQAIATGDLVASSLGAAFSAVGNLAGELVTTGSANVRKFFADLTAQIAKMYMNQFVAQMLAMFLPSFGPSAGGGGGVTSYGLKVGAFPSANGNVFDSGSVQRFAKGGAFTNQLATGPTLAPMALFGEAGPEAIMPLTRTSGGELGVKAIPTGMEGGMSQVIHVETNVYVQGNGNTSTDTTTSGGGGAADRMAQSLSREVTQIARDVVRQEIGQGGLIRTAIKQGA